MVEPVQRAQRKYLGTESNPNGLKRWLELNGWLDHDRFISFADRFHPDRRFHPITRELDLASGRFPFATAFESMERGELDRDLIRMAWPDLASQLPKRVRLSPPQKWHELTLMVSAHLAAYEVEFLNENLGGSPVDESAVAKRLYWFERFYSLWQRTAETKRPKALNTVKAEVKAVRINALLAFHDQFIKRHPGASAARVVKDFKPSDEFSGVRLLADKDDQAKELRAALKRRASRTASFE